MSMDMINSLPWSKWPKILIFKYNSTEIPQVVNNGILMGFYKL